MAQNSTAKTNSLATQNLAAKTGSLLTSQFGSENRFATNNVFGRNHWPIWATVDLEIVDENQVATESEIINAT